MLKSLKVAGKYITTAGLVATYCMAVVGTVSIDIVLFTYLVKKSNENNSGFNGFLTGYLWGTMFSDNHHQSTPRNAIPLLIFSPFLTGIAIGLSFILGVPQVGMVLALGWVISLAIVGIGTGISKAAEVATQFTVPSEPDCPCHHDAGYNPNNTTYHRVQRETRQTRYRNTTSVNYHYAEAAYVRSIPSTTYCPRRFSYPSENEHYELPVATPVP